MEKGVLLRITALHSVMQITATAWLTLMINDTTFTAGQSAAEVNKSADPLSRSSDVSFSNKNLLKLENKPLIAICHSCLISVWSGCSVICSKMAGSRSSGWW